MTNDLGRLRRATVIGFAAVVLGGALTAVKIGLDVRSIGDLNSLLTLGGVGIVGAASWRAAAVKRSAEKALPLAPWSPPPEWPPPAESTRTTK